MHNRHYKTGFNRHQSLLIPPSVKDYVSENNKVRAIDAYVDTLDLFLLGFKNTNGVIKSGQPALGT